MTSINDINGKVYVVRQRGYKGHSANRHNIWMIRADNGGGVINLKAVHFPRFMIGRRVRFIVELANEKKFDITEEDDVVVPN